MAVMSSSVRRAQCWRNYEKQMTGCSIGPGSRGFAPRVILLRAAPLVSGGREQGQALCRPAMALTGNDKDSMPRASPARHQATIVREPPIPPGIARAGLQVGKTK